MRLLIDTNVILDIIFNRKGCETAINLLKKIEQEEGECLYAERRLDFEGRSSVILVLFC